MGLIPAAAMPQVKRFGWSGALALAVVVAMLAGVNPITLISGKASPPPPPTSITGVPASSATVEQIAIRYPRVMLSVIDSSSTFGCGTAGKDLTVLYCPDTRTVYVDSSAYERLCAKFPLGADYAVAYLAAEGLV